MSFTKLSAGSFELERQIQRLLVMDSALLVRITEAFLNQAEVKAGMFRFLDRV
jgi:hypothetical protein